MVDNLHKLNYKRRARKKRMIIRLIIHRSRVLIVT